jgi:nucleoside-diphosphate-sugar epimerase
MKKTLITGATGFIGSSLARRLLQDGHEVHLLIRSEYKPWRIEDIQSSIRLHLVDLADAEEVKALVCSIQPEWVFHLAAFGAYSYQQGIHRMIDTNLVGTINLVDACVTQGVESFIYAGSSSEYGNNSNAPRETDWIDPNSHYAITKAAATHYCRLTAIQSNIHIVTLRLYSVYGPYEEPSRLIPRLILFGRRGKLPPLVNPDIARDFIYIDDVAAAFMSAAACTDMPRGTVLNIGSGAQTTIADLVEIVRELFEIEVEPQWGEMLDRSWDVAEWVADISSARQTLGWQPNFTLEQGLKATRNWLENDPIKLKLYYDMGYG